MGSTRIRGNKLGLILDSEEEVWADCTSLKLTPEEADSDVLTFEDAQSGNTSAWKLTGTAVQSTDPDSLWSLLYDNAGQELPFTYAPHGNENPAPAQPHFTGTVKVTLPPEIGGEADRSTTSAFTFDFELEVVGQPVKVTA